MEFLAAKGFTLRRLCGVSLSANDGMVADSLTIHLLLGRPQDNTFGITIHPLLVWRVLV